MRRATVLFPLLLALAYALGAVVADPGTKGRFDGLVQELRSRQAWLDSDVERVVKAAKDVAEIRRQRASGEYVISGEEVRMEKRGRVDFHIFLERIRNDTLEVLEIYDRVLHKQEFVPPLERLYGKALHDVVEVDWEDLPLDDVAAELTDSYGVPVRVSGMIDYRRTMTLQGELSLLSILLYIEQIYEAHVVVRDGALYVEKPGGEKDPLDD